jgi:ATP-binding cassette, subfamily B, bacterial PglK
MTLRQTIGASYRMLSPGEKRRMARLLALIVATGLVDALGLASVLPFLAVLAKPEVIHTNGTLRSLYGGLGFAQTGHFLLFLGALTFGALILTNTLNAWMVWRSTKFSMNVGHGLSMRMLAFYLRQPYVFYLNENSSKILVDVAGRVFDLVHGVLMPSLQIASRAVLAGFVFVLVFLVNPLLSLGVAAVICGGYGLAYLAIRNRVRHLGQAGTAANEARVRIATEAFSGIKDLKVLGREEFFERRYQDASLDYTDKQARNTILGALPRYALEVIAIGSMIGAVLHMLLAGRDLVAILPIVGLYAFAAYRLMPAIQQIYQSAALIRFTGASIEVLDSAVATLRTAPPPAPAVAAPPLAFRESVAFENVTFRFPGRTEAVVRELAFEIPKNASIGLVGPTGAGKSTVLDLALGLLEPTSGRIAVDGAALGTHNHAQWRRSIGYVPQAIYLSDDSVARNIAFGIEDREIDLEAVASAARLAQIDDFIRGLPDGYRTKVGERGVRLSGGQRQRIGIARALYHRPQLLVFDEATSALDSVTEATIVEELAALAGRVTLLIVAHRITTVKNCDFILLLENGVIADRGSYAELLARNSRFRGLAA